MKSYDYIKSRQIGDMKARRIVIDFNRHFSTPFTWMLSNLNINPNWITVASFFICLIGFMLLAQGTYICLLLGLLFFIFFRIADMVDGEVARLLNRTSGEGILLDRIAHYIFHLSLGVGIGIGFFNLYNNQIYFFLGFFFAMAFVLENVVFDITKSTLRELILKKGKIIFQNKTDKHYYLRLLEKIHDGRYWGKSGIFSKLFAVYPFQGIFYSGDTFAAPILFALTLLQFFLVYAKLTIFFPIARYLVPSYLLIATICKFLWIILFLYSIEKHGHITSTVKEG